MLTIQAVLLPFIGPPGWHNVIGILLNKADPEVLEEVAKELDKEEYNPYTDNRDDEELTEEELSQRQSRKLYAPDGSLAANPGGKKVKSAKIKSIKEKINIITKKLNKISETITNYYEKNTNDTKAEKDDQQRILDEIKGVANEITEK
jgi:hypothetical protein